MKNKLFSIFTALAMVLGILVAPFTSAQAADDDAAPTGTLSADQLVAEKPATTELVINKLKAKGYKEGAPWAHNGGQIGKDDLKKLGTEVEGLKDVQFTIYKLSDNVDLENMVANRGKYKTEADLKNLPTLDGQNNGTATKEATQPAKTDENGQATASLAEGKYWVIETSKPKDVTGAIAVPFGITLPLMNSEKVGEHEVGTMYLSKVYVYPKNTTGTPKIDKNFDIEKNGDVAGITEDELISDTKDLNIDTTNNKRDKSTATKNVGDQVPYKVVTEIPQSSDYKTLRWTDSMDKGLSFDNGSLKIKLGDTELVNTEETTYFTLIEDNHGFVLRLAEAGLTAVKTAAKDADAKITLTYTATLTKEAEVDTAQKNDVKLDYSNHPGQHQDPKEGNPKEGKIEVNKSWAVDGTEVTEGDKTVEVEYILQKKNGEKWEDVESVTKKYDNNNVQDSFKHEFAGLTDTDTYRVVEKVSGYAPEYTSFENGVVQIKNNTTTDTPDPLDPSEPGVVYGGKRFIKTAEKDTEKLSGAQFYVKNKAGQYLVAAFQDENAVNQAKANRDKALNAYNDRKDDTNKDQLKQAFDQAQKAYFDAFEQNKSKYTWADAVDGKAPQNAITLTSGEKGEFEIIGLAYNKSNETYFLEEFQAPKGYAINEKEIPFTVAKYSYEGTKDGTNKIDKPEHLDYTKVGDAKVFGQRIKNKNLTIPQTGGIGSLIFVVAGLAIMAGAYVAYRKSQARA
ncbi:SpaH/EbpB family LPXTG-anchored major pilin [Anaerococcus sp.]|uniref:SpaH/EbpB family LPXTG-anchored major pilin n=1 Tax=Anaerococcus sp. TaxID=1872515 RepID=UPI0027B941D5|nr:SpaH/EbpB family LPXTG-anchored major pilin [Anaerococcus sp.]